MHKYAIIVAGGKGERMGSEVPKQFIEVKGKPILMHTINKFLETYNDIKIILVLPKNQFDYWEGLCVKYQFNTKEIILTEGGKSRFHSVKNGLKHISQNSILAIHDGVRPLVSSTTIKTCFEAVKEHQAVIPVIDVVDSLRYVSKEGNKSVKRSCYKAVQTPQCFSSEIILKAYNAEFDNSFTDDASVVEALGESIVLVEGNTENIKITTPQDLKLAELLL